MSTKHVRPRKGAPRLRETLLLIVLVGHAPPTGVLAQADPPVRYDLDLLPPAFHQGRRDAVLGAVPADAVAVFLSAPERTRSNDVSYEYRQDSDLLYLTGTHEPGSVLVLAPEGVEVEGRRAREILFVPPRDPGEEVWLGRRFGPERAGQELGVAESLPLTRLEEVLGPMLQDPSRRVFHLPVPAGVDEAGTLGRQLVLLRGARASLDGVRLRRLLDDLRTVKTEEETAVLRRAIDITVLAHREAMRSIVPGMHEYEVEALIEYVFARNGSQHPAFPSIVGSGENTVILHYESNRRRIEDADLVLMDIGAEYHGYSADVTRTVPANGVFSPEQRAVYELVLRAQEAGIAAARAGSAFHAPHLAAERVLAEGLARLGLISSASDRAGVRRFFPHATSHYLGLDVHDVGAGGPLEAGTVITVEPGIYIAPAPDVDAKWWNIGVRIEDDVLVTAGDPVVLSAGAPRDPDEIEALMREEGLGNQPAGRLPPAAGR